MTMQYVLEEDTIRSPAAARFMEAATGGTIADLDTGEILSTPSTVYSNQEPFFDFRDMHFFSVCQDLAEMQPYSEIEYFPSATVDTSDPEDQQAALQYVLTSCV
jgi:hypothetical protein